MSTTTTEQDQPRRRIRIEKGFASKQLGTTNWTEFDVVWEDQIDEALRRFKAAHRLSNFRLQEVPADTVKADVPQFFGRRKAENRKSGAFTQTNTGGFRSSALGLR